MKYECAVFKYLAIKEGFLTVWGRVKGKDWEPEGYVRVSEWVEVEFPMLAGDVVAEAKRREIEVTRKKLQAELAALDSGDAK